MITGLCEGLLEYARDYWSIQGITGICEGLLEYARDYWSMQVITGLCNVGGPLIFIYIVNMDKLPTPASQQLVSVNEGRVRVIISHLMVFRLP